jgi:hypothetical protein
MNTRRMVVIAFLSVVLFVLQVVLAYLPNIELVTLLFIIYILHLPLVDVIYISFVFTTLQGLMYGFHTWTLMYYFIWSFYCFIAHLIKNKLNNWFKIALLSGVFGLIFGSLHSIPYFFMGGYNMGKAYIISGLIFDLVHGIGNFILAVILFDPINHLFKKLIKKESVKNL